MAPLNIRNLPAEIHHERRLRAARHHRSMAAEARAILGEACRPSLREAVTRVQGWSAEQYGPHKPAGVAPKE